MTEGNTVPARFYERASLPTVGGRSDRTAQGVEGKKKPVRYAGCLSCIGCTGCASCTRCTKCGRCGMAGTGGMTATAARLYLSNLCQKLPYLFQVG